MDRQQWLIFACNKDGYWDCSRFIFRTLVEAIRDTREMLDNPIFDLINRSDAMTIVEI